jgi:glycine cleavage system H protein
MPTIYYSKDHEWVAIGADGLATVGITEHAQQALGDIVFVELPDPGRSVVKGEACAVVESVKAASDVYAPLSGMIVEHNPAIIEDPASINQTPAEAWFFKMRLADPSAVTDLLDKSGYDAFLETL